MLINEAQDREFRQLCIALEEIYYVRNQNDGTGNPVPEEAKARTKDFLEKTARLAALAKEIAANGEPARRPDTAEKAFGPMADKAKQANSGGAVHPETMKIIERDGERADVIRAKMRADATARRIQEGRRGK